LPRMATDNNLTQEDKVAKKEDGTAAGELAKEGNFAEKASSPQKTASPRMASFPKMVTPGRRPSHKKRRYSSPMSTVSDTKRVTSDDPVRVALQVGNFVEG
jgi:hypothetical protein